MMANRLKNVIKTRSGRIYPMQRRKILYNTSKVLSLIHYSKIQQIPLIVLTTDTEKAFDRLLWDFLHGTIKGFGLGDTPVDRFFCSISRTHC